jgi:hypothetical protein
MGQGPIFGKVGHVRCDECAQTWRSHPAQKTFPSQGRISRETSSPFRPRARHPTGAPPLTGPKISSAHIWANVYAGRNLSQTACCAVNVRLTLVWSGQAPSAPGLRRMGKFDAGAGKLSTSVTRAKPIQLIDGDRRMKHGHKLRQRLIKQALIFSPSRKPGAILRREEPHGLKTGIRHGARRKPGLPSILRQPVEVN